VTPTPGPDGNIVYEVQAGDTLVGICVYMLGRNDLQCIDDLKNMNGLQSDILSVGQKIIIAKAAPPTQPPTAVPTAAPPTATSDAPAAVAVGKVCLLLFEDTNGNMKLDNAEGQVVPGGTLSVVDATTGEALYAYKTTAADTGAQCFDNLPVGLYTFAVAPPAGYNATSPTSQMLKVESGLQYKLDFGAQPAGSTTSGGASGNKLGAALFGAVGVVLLLLAAGIAAFLMLRQR
jgi:hypothetical protein